MPFRNKVFFVQLFRIWFVSGGAGYGSGSPSSAPVEHRTEWKFGYNESVKAIKTFGSKVGQKAIAIAEAGDDWNRTEGKYYGLFVIDLSGTRTAFRIYNHSREINYDPFNYEATNANQLAKDAALEMMPTKKIGVVARAVGKRLGMVVTKVGFKTLSQLGLKDGMKVSSSKALELGEQFLGKGYKELVHGSSRYVSADGTRVFRMGVCNIYWRLLAFG
ncbi:hypothetical protein SAMN05421780_101794 [Flexibacter flexilis DSM 6793]|uniref:Uncharacterized protein n=1 Tax=Flexibacter flexilis DSM 6793 TaxID=927664 RepID=A0A1I1EHL1_9BACT|nr:hypothetical protein [Flexibacter flexilis]SFB86102.1 hypothetical protein SAMN05421780_101794 [Flexibacter flexilis DSM 6793]